MADLAVTNVQDVEGNVDHDAVDIGSPVKIGGYGKATAPTAASADGDRVNAWYSLFGAANVILRDTSGAAIATGVQFLEDGALGSTPQGTLHLARRVDTLGTLTPVVDDAVSMRLNSRGALWVTSDDPAADAVDTGNPLKIGGHAYSGVPGAVSASNDRTDAAFTLRGGLHVNPRDASGVELVGTPADAFATAPGANALAFLMAFNGTSSDRLRTTPSLSAAPNADTGVLAVGTGPGFDRKVNPANLGTVVNNAITNTIDGADTFTYAIGTTTTGTFTFEVSGDDSQWIAALAMEVPVEAGITGTNLTPTANKLYMVLTSGYRQVRIRTVTTLGATVAVKTTATVGLKVPRSPYAWWPLITKTAQYTTTQTGAALWTPASGKRIVVLYYLIAVGGTTAGTMQLWFGATADTTYTRGTDRAVFDHEFAPSTTLKPGVVVHGGGSRIGEGAIDDVLRVTDSAAINPLTVTVWGVEI